jgi:hypothetical protein
LTRRESAGGVGLNLQHATVALNMDLPWNPAVPEQRIDRVQRLGQKQSVHVVKFVAKNTIEQDMLSVLKFKTSLFAITADRLLHLYLVQFDETLKDIEEREFYPDFTALTQALLTQLAAHPLPAATEDFREAQKKALTDLAIALKCLKPEAPPPAQVDPKDVGLVLTKMKQHEGFSPNPYTAHQEWPLLRYAEDFSQYAPRGHYTRSEELKKHFTGMMWLDRMTLTGKQCSVIPARAPGFCKITARVPSRCVEGRMCLRLKPRAEACPRAIMCCAHYLKNCISIPLRHEEPRQRCRGPSPLLTLPVEARMHSFVL